MINLSVNVSSVSASATASKTAKAKTQTFPKPELKGLKNFEVLLGKTQIRKFKNQDLKSKFKDMDVYDWFLVNGEPALVVGVYIPTHGKSNQRFAQSNSKSEYANVVKKVAKYCRKGFSMIELHIGKDHILVLTYAA